MHTCPASRAASLPPDPACRLAFRAAFYLSASHGHSLSHRLHRSRRLRRGHPAPALLRAALRCLAVRGDDDDGVLFAGAVHRRRRCSAGCRTGSGGGRCCWSSLACSIAVLSLARLAPALWMLFAARLLAGAGAGNIAAAQAYIADVTPPEKRAKGMGMIGAAFGLGFTVGPAIGGVARGRRSAPRRSRAPGLSRRRALGAWRSSSPRCGSRKACRPRRAAPRRGPGARAGARARFARPVLRQPHPAVLRHGQRLRRHGDDLRALGQWRLRLGARAGRLDLLLCRDACWRRCRAALIGRLSRRFGEARLVTAGAAIIGIGLLGLALRRRAVGRAGGDRAARDRHGAAQPVGDKPRLARRRRGRARRHHGRVAIGVEPRAHRRPRRGGRGLHAAGAATRPIYLGALAHGGGGGDGAAPAAPRRRRSRHEGTAPGQSLRTTHRRSGSGRS